MVFIRVIRVHIINALLIKSVITAEKIMKNLVRYFNIFYPCILDNQTLVVLIFKTSL